MPELPEVEHLRRTLQPHLLGKKITAVSLRTPDIINHRTRKSIPPKPYPTPNPCFNPHHPESLLLGSVITELRRHGKKLAIITDTGKSLSVSLGMTGQLYYIHTQQRLPDQKHVHLIWNLASTDNSQTNQHAAGRLIYRDTRRFGSIDPFPTFDNLFNTLWLPLGPDALTITSPALTKALLNSRAPVKAAILNQHLIAGIGNIYADESLFRAHIHPETPANIIQPPQIKQLADAIRTILRKSIRFGGTTYRDFVDADHQPGQNAPNLKIYGRAGKNCLSCHQPLLSTKIAGRTTIYCPQCQPREVIHNLSTP